jgi:hypothetical protein
MRSIVRAYQNRSGLRSATSRTAMKARNGLHLSRVSASEWKIGCPVSLFPFRNPRRVLGALLHNRKKPQPQRYQPRFSRKSRRDLGSAEFCINVQLPIRSCQNLSLTCLKGGKPIHFTAFDCHRVHGLVEIEAFPSLVWLTPAKVPPDRPYRTPISRLPRNPLLY